MKKSLEMLCVSRMNSVMRKKFYQVIADRDGEYCKGCGTLPSERPLVIDHRDNNNFNNLTENLQLLCRRCNYLKNPRPVDKCVSEGESGNPVTSELEQNQKKEWKFRKYIYTRLEEQESISINEIILAGAEAIGISPVTARRYLDKMCSVEGPCFRKREGDTIMIAFRPQSNFR